MIIDVHQHLISAPATMKKDELELWAQRLAEGFDRAHGRGARSERVDVSIETSKERFLAYAPDPDGKKMIRRKAEDGIDVTIVCVVDNAARGGSDESIMEQNRSCAQMAAESNGKLVALAGIDPRRREAPQLFRTCIEEYGMKGLKWHPDHGYLPNDEAAYAVLKVAEELGVPLLTHTGLFPVGAIPSSNPGLLPRVKYATVAPLDDVALDFPELKIVAAHMGGLHEWREFAALAQYRYNLYGDLAMWQVRAVTNYESFCRDLREILDVAGSDSVLFGTDDPYLSALVPNDEFVRIIRELPEKAPAGIRFSEEEVAAILGGNAQKVFGLVDG